MPACKFRHHWAALVIGLAAVAPACAAHGDIGIAQNKAGLANSVIAAFVGRNAGTGTFRHRSDYADHVNDAVIQRLLELAPDRRDRPADVLVNEAVAYASGYSCPSYKHLPLRMKGCPHQTPPAHIWRDADEVARSAVDLGFVCDPPQSSALTCAYHGTISEHRVRFLLSPSIDGEPDGPEDHFEDTAILHYAPGVPPHLVITEMETVLVSGQR